MSFEEPNDPRSSKIGNNQIQLTELATYEERTPDVAMGGWEFQQQFTNFSQSHKSENGAGQSSDNRVKKSNQVSRDETLGRALYAPLWVV